MGKQVKLSDNKISKSLQYYAERLKPKHAIQIVAKLKQEYRQNNCRVLGLSKALKVLFNFF